MSSQVLKSSIRWHVCILVAKTSKTFFICIWSILWSGFLLFVNYATYYSPYQVWLIWMHICFGNSCGRYYVFNLSHICLLNFWHDKFTHKMWCYIMVVWTKHLVATHFNNFSFVEMVSWKFHGLRFAEFVMQIWIQGLSSCGSGFRIRMQFNQFYSFHWVSN